MIMILSSFFTDEKRKEIITHFYPNLEGSMKKKHLCPVFVYANAQKKKWFINFQCEEPRATNDGTRNFMPVVFFSFFSFFVHALQYGYQWMVHAQTVISSKGAFVRPAIGGRAVLIATCGCGRIAKDIWIISSWPFWHDIRELILPNLLDRLWKNSE